MRINSENSRVAVEGRTVTDEFELARTLYTLLQQTSEKSDLAEGDLKGVGGEPQL